MCSIGGNISDYMPNKYSALMPDGSINKEWCIDEYIGSYVLIFFYPSDFSFVCPTEILAHNSRLSQFHSRNVNVIGISIDSEYTHFAWTHTSVNNGGVGKIGFPLVSDINREICHNFDIFHTSGVSYRASYLVDKAGVIRHQVINDLPFGRNVDEMLRMVDAIQEYELHGDVCPAGWKKGKKTIKATPKGVANYLRENKKNL